MAKFLFVYRGGSDNPHKMTPEQMQKNMEKWGAWIQEGMSKGWMVDPGDGLTEEGRLVDPKVVADGPFVESKEIIGGFIVIRANSIDEAAEIASGAPLVGVGSVEVRPIYLGDDQK